jgi:hypothetical protein
MLTCPMMARAAQLPATAPATIPAQPAHATPEQIDQAIKRAQEYLLNKDLLSNAPAAGAMYESNIGQGSLAAYALLVSGISEKDPKLAAILKQLKMPSLRETYPCALRALMLSELREEPSSLRPLIERDARMLMAGMKGGDVEGLYSYLLAADDRRRSGSRYDHSCSNYGTMGTWACAESGFDVPDTYWRAVNSAWRNNQHADGSWSYTHGSGENQGTPSMTAGGVVTLFLTQQYIDRTVSAVPRDTPRDKNLDAGVKWLAANFDKIRGAWPYYTIFNIQRVGLNTGYKYFDKIDWYQRICDDLVRIQSPQGSFGTICDTGWALSFLALGRAPVIFNKLQYNTGKDDAEGWNQRSRDIANLAKWFSRQSKRHFNWQVVETKMSIETLHDSPILYLSGNRELTFTPDDLALLQRYVEEGGLILGNANGASKKFVESFIKLGNQLFPQYAFRELPANHPIYVDQRWPREKMKRKPPPVMALGNGSREFMLLLGGDPARSWQGYRPSFDQTKVTGGKDEDFQLIGDIISYSVERSHPRYKGETYIIEQREDAPATREIVLARLEYDGNWDPEPFGWQQLAKRLHNEFATDLASATVKLGAAQLDGRFPVAHLTGTGKLVLDERARQEIRRYAYEGGVLIVDACGGSSEFAESAEAELTAIFGQATQPIPIGHPLYSIGATITAMEYRETAREKLLTDLDKPRLRGIEQNGKLVVIFSPQDLSTGMVGHPIDGIVGYTPDSASKLMINALLYAAQAKK